MSLIDGDLCPSYIHFYIIILLCVWCVVLFQMDEIEREIENILNNYNTGIIEDSIEYVSGRLRCMSNKYQFEINPHEFSATNRKTDFEEFKYSHKMLLEPSLDPELLESVLAINHFIAEYNALDLTEIIEDSIHALETGESRNFNWTD